MTLKANGPIWEIKTDCENINVTIQPSQYSDNIKINGRNFTVGDIFSFAFYLQFIGADEEPVVEWECLDDAIGGIP